MQIFEVFAKIALDIREFEAGLNRAAQKMAEFAKKMSEYAAKVRETMNEIGITFKTCAEKACDALERTGGAIGTVIEWLRDMNVPLTTISSLGALAAGNLAALGSKLKLLLNPIALVAVGVTLLIGYFVNLVRNCEEMQQKLVAAWEKIRDFIAPVMEFIGGLVEKVFGGIQDFLYRHGESIREVFALAWEAISLIVGVVTDVIMKKIGVFVAIITRIWDVFGDNILGIVRAVWDMISNVFGGALDIIKGIFNIFIGIFTGDWERAWDGIKNIVRGAMDIISGILSGIVEIGRNVIQGLWNGISSMGTWIADKLRTFFDNTVLGTVLRALGIRSPSRVFADQVGKMIVQGVACGISDEAHIAEKAAVQMAEDMLKPQVDVFAEKYAEIKRIVVTMLEKMSRMAYQIVRAMTALIDARLTVDGRQIGRNFFRALGDGLIDAEAGLMAEALRVADALRDVFDRRQADIHGFGASAFAMAHPMASASSFGTTINQYFYGVREEKTAYQAYRAAQKVAWGIVEK